MHIEVLTDKIEEMEKEGELLKASHKSELDNMEGNIRVKFDELIKDKERRISDYQNELSSLQQKLQVQSQHLMQQ